MSCNAWRQYDWVKKIKPIKKSITIASIFVEIYSEKIRTVLPIMKFCSMVGVVLPQIGAEHNLWVSEAKKHAGFVDMDLVMPAPLRDSWLSVGRMNRFYIETLTDSNAISAACKGMFNVLDCKDRNCAQALSDYVRERCDDPAPQLHVRLLENNEYVLYWKAPCQFDCRFVIGPPQKRSC
jgi:hypothetical protein